MSKPKTEWQFFAALPESQFALAKALRCSVVAGTPNAKVSVRSGWLYFELAGPICWLQPHADHLSLVFPRGGRLPDPGGYLEGAGARRQLSVRTAEEIDVAAIIALASAGETLNRENPSG